jgi:CRP-like cAMP-binding protein/Zn-dependent protease
VPARGTKRVPLERSLSADARPNGRGPLSLEAAIRADSLRDGAVWDELEARLDPAEFRPKLAADIERKIFRLRWGNDYALVANPRELLHYELTVDEAELLPLMDGTRTIGEIVVERLRDEGDMDVAEVVELVHILRQGGFLDPRPPDVDGALQAALHPVSPGRKRAREFAKTLMIHWEGADGFVRRVYPLLRWAFTPAAAVVFAVIALSGLVAFVAVQTSGRYAFSPTRAPAESLILLGLGLVLTFVHELSHALVVVHEGRRVKSAGFMLYFGSPAFFVDVSDGLLMEPRQRVLQAAGGPVSELVLAGAATIVLWAFPDVSGASLLYKFVVINYFVIFMNLVPLLELDGYFMLCDLIEVPDLRPRSLAFMQHDLWHKLRSREALTKQEIGLLVYGVVGIAFTIFSLWTAAYFWREVFGGLIRGLWDSGILGRVLLVVLGLFFAGPAIRGLAKLGRALARRVSSSWRKLRFRLETSWRVEAAELIDALPLFEDLPEASLSALAGRVRLRGLRREEPVFRQGERAGAFFVVRRGRIRIEEEDPASGTVRTLRSLERGDPFGELGLLEGAARTATARADEASEVFVVDKGTFDRLLADAATPPDLAPTLQSLSELRALPAFTHLGSRELGELLRQGSWIRAAPGDDLVRQGDPGDAFYAIGAGQADVLEDGAAIRRLGPGGYFGEIALLRDVPRTATVRAVTPVRAFRLERDGFDALVAGSFDRGVLRPSAGRTWEH